MSVDSLQTLWPYVVSDMVLSQICHYRGGRVIRPVTDATKPWINYYCIVGKRLSWRTKTLAVQSISNSILGKRGNMKLLIILHASGGTSVVPGLSMQEAS